jgi:RsiW-degrading membrane proteinase PrsW (M82 family)
MESKPNSTAWRSILLIIFGAGGGLLFIISGIGILIITAINEQIVLETNVTPLIMTLVASTLIAIGLLLLPVTWLSLQRLRGVEFSPLVLPPLRLWAWIAIPSLWLLSITLATLYQGLPSANWFTPFLHFLSIALPIYLVLRVSINRIPLGSSQRAWGVFAAGMSLSPLLAFIAEITVVALAVFAVAFYLGMNPELMASVERLVAQIQHAPNMDSLVYVIGPLLKNPLTLLAALIFLSFLVPVIEESAKSLGVWLVADLLQTPAQGFAMGVLSGAGFALAESLSASLTADSSWAFTLSVRAISSSMHMLATGLFGWGIAYARLEKRYLRLVGMTMLAILLHAAWNAGAVFTVAGGVSVMLSMPDIDFLGSLMSLGGISLLFVLMAGMIVAFFVLNARLRDPSLPSPPAPKFEETSQTTIDMPKGG